VADERELENKIATVVPLHW